MQRTYRWILLAVVLFITVGVGFADDAIASNPLYYEDEEGKYWVDGETLYLEGTDGYSGQFSEDSGYLETEEGLWKFEGDSMVFEATDGSGMYMSTSGPLRWPETLSNVPKPEGNLVLQIVMPGYYSYAFDPVDDAVAQRYVGMLRSAGFEDVDYPELAELMLQGSSEGVDMGIVYIAVKGEYAVMLLANAEGYTIFFQPSSDLTL